MTDKEINIHKQHIENVIIKTFDIIEEVYNNQQEINQQEINILEVDKSESRILFPKKSSPETTRVSEQELRFVFAEQLKKEIGNGEEWDVYYSVETPTMKKYLFKDNFPKRDENDGQSANFDLVIHDSNYNRIALIEFKAKNPDIHDYQKDFVKLTNEQEDGELRYFIQILENTNSNTDSNVKSKIIPTVDKNWMKQWGEHKVIVHCISLEKGRGNRVVINFQEYPKSC